MALTAPVLVPVVAAVKRARHRLAEADLLALEIAADGIDAQRCQKRIAGCLRPIDDADADDEENGHGRQNRASLANVADDAAEGENGSDRDQQQRPDLEDVGPGVGVFERMRRIGVEEAAAVGAQLLDDSWLAIGPMAMVCFAPSSVVASTEPASVCGTPSATKPAPRRSLSAAECRA